MRPEDFMYFLNQMSKQLPAESKSVRSDLTMPRLTGEAFWGAKNSIAVLVGICCTGCNPIQEEFIRNHFYKKALERNEKGSWRIVSRLCQQTPWTPYWLAWILFEEYDRCEIYGNWIPLIAKILPRVRWVNPYLRNTRPVKRSQRKRGYTDKGSLGSSVEAPGLASYVSPTDLKSVSTTFADSLPQGALANSYEDSRIRAQELLLQEEEEQKEKSRNHELEMVIAHIIPDESDDTNDENRIEMPEVGRIKGPRVTSFWLDRN